VAITQGFPPETATTMIVINAMINDTPVMGGMSTSFRVVFLFLPLLKFLAMFPLRRLLWFMVVLLDERSFLSRRFCDSPQF
jgi:hypothetical protein